MRQQEMDIKASQDNFEELFEAVAAPLNFSGRSLYSIDGGACFKTTS
jgi:hypothetical protein